MKQPQEHDSRPSSVEGPDEGDWNADLRPLRNRLRALARAERAAPPPRELEAAVMHAWDRRHPPLRSRVVRWFGAAAAAAALVVLAYTARYEPTPSPDPRTRTAEAMAPARSAQQAMTDVVLIGAPPMPGERIQVVRTRIARDLLMSMGVRPVAADGDMVDIAMLIGEDGVARGVRVETDVR
jgi:hypothetical protein